MGQMNLRHRASTEFQNFNDNPYKHTLQDPVNSPPNPYHYRSHKYQTSNVLSQNKEWCKSNIDSQTILSTSSKF